MHAGWGNGRDQRGWQPARSTASTALCWASAHPAPRTFSSNHSVRVNECSTRNWDAQLCSNRINLAGVRARFRREPAPETRLPGVGRQCPGESAQQTPKTPSLRLFNFFCLVLCYITNGLVSLARTYQYSTGAWSRHGCAESSLLLSDVAGDCRHRSGLRSRPRRHRRRLR